ncbi:MAG: hypothetical protein AABX83_04185 [Nanoarchaeota archaeon]
MGREENSLEDIAKVSVGCAGTIALMGAGAFAGALLGVGSGFVLGNIIDYIPLINKVAPKIAEYVGFQPDLNMNENFYQLTCGVAGLYNGLGFIPGLLNKSSKR